MSAHLKTTAVAGAILLAAGITTSTSQPAPADLVLRNGKVVTMDAAKPEAAAIAIRGGRIAAVGTNDEIAAYVGPSTEVVDLSGRLAIPGFIEAHGHFTGIGEALMQLGLGPSSRIQRRKICAGRRESDSELLRERVPEAEGWPRLLSGTANDA